LQRIAPPLLQAPLLLAPVDIEIVFAEPDPGVDQHLLEGRHYLEELARLPLCAEAHHRLGTCALVPAAIEQHHLARRREVADIALKIPGMPFAVRGRTER